VGKNALQEETCVPATPKSDHLIPKVQEQPDGGLVQADCKNTESQTEEGFTSPAEVLFTLDMNIRRKTEHLQAHVDSYLRFYL
jgi:hypothetical protein